jgi:hypothetical protein
MMKNIVLLSMLLSILPAEAGQLVRTGAWPIPCRLTANYGFPPDGNGKGAYLPPELMSRWHQCQAASGGGALYVCGVNANCPWRH